MTGLPLGSLSTIRVRLTAALAAALLPVLLLGMLQSALAFNREGAALRDNLALAAERSAATARARITSAEVLLETLDPGSVGFRCAERLAQIRARIPGYANLIRFDAQGRVVCAAGSTPNDAARLTRPWFRALARGEPLVVTRDPGVAYSGEPAVLAAAPARDAAGRFTGAYAAVMALSSLRPSNADATLPRDAQVALVNAAGQAIELTDAKAFSRLPQGWRAKAAAGSFVWYARDTGGARRIYSAAPLVGDDIFVVLSAPAPGVFSWARLNPLTGIVFPLLAFALSLLAVTVATDRVVIRWIAYLQRIASLYAKGRLSVRAVQAENAPPEIRDLAETLEDMADAIVGRDASLRDSLAQKDALMREIHHRVKNNLQVISSLLSMQQRALSDPAARAAMSDTRQRITALALIYRALYQGPDLKRVDLRPFLEELTAQLIAGDMAHHPAVRTDIHVDALVIDPDRLAPLALFAVEAITNAQKHAFSQRGGALTVVFRVRGEEAELEIADDGAAPDDALVAAGVGRTLMTAFARQLRGRADMARNAKGGITARLIFPTPSIVEDEPSAGGELGNRDAA